MGGLDSSGCSWRLTFVDDERWELSDPDCRSCTIS